ncbi:MAG: response regulator transcription factor [Saprospiraceae bacterium]|nr:response regulator transcription factor [Saprospiraceae bacterium]MCF8251781.1 response regulator transcription factor [Saprospiraceae bacterium]MCF8281267.1 response regulator transcription factor [Bacteroidales bacterium]MCF8313423.1 response regulator transcription factor [Saprospiraceae bacterium]MCF8442136.1 response regulator transcription factor [Saprospiraceae bacterium]
MKVLLIDDEVSINGFINKGLSENGFDVTQAFDGEMGLRLARNNSFDVIILDLILPGINGLEVCRKLREAHQIQTPILMLTALNTTDDVVEGLNSGADDYLGKPFKFQELLARVRALGRRSGQIGGPTNLLQVADLTMDLDQKIVTRAGLELQLTLKEFLLLECLIRNKNRVLSRLDLLEKVWGIHFDTGTNVVDVYMNYLRNKIDKPFDQKLIQTVVGMGYVIRE